MKVIDKPKLLEFKVNGGKTLVRLEDYEENQGKITLEDTVRGDYSMYWGAMGGTIRKFVLSINSDYFVGKLIGIRNSNVFDPKATFVAINEYLLDEGFIRVARKYPDFYRNFKDRLKDFKADCEECPSERYFVDTFHMHMEQNLWLITDEYDRESVKKIMSGIDEPWSFINTKQSNEAKWLNSTHSRIKNKLKKLLCENVG